MAPPTIQTTKSNDDSVSNNSPMNTKNNNKAIRMKEQIVCGPYSILSPPIKKQMISGHLLPTLRSATAISMLQQPKRQISIVIYNTNTNTNTTNTTTTSLSSDTTATNTNKSTTLTTNVSQLQDDDHVIVRICRLSSDLPNTSSPKNSNNTNDSNNNSPTNINNNNTIITTSTDSNNTSNNNHWVEHKVYRLEEIQILKQKKDSIEVQLGLGNDTIVRDYKFIHENEVGSSSSYQHSDSHIQHFCSTLLIMKQLEKERSIQQIEQYKKQNTITTTSTTSGTTSHLTTTPTGMIGHPTTHGSLDHINILVEIVSATNLPIADLLATDPYIVVRFGSKEIHRTSVISKNLSPIYTLHTGSLFLIICTLEEFFHAVSGLSFTIKDYDQVGSNDLLGTIHVPLQHLLNGTGSRVSYPIELVNNNKPDTLDVYMNDAATAVVKEITTLDTATAAVNEITAAVNEITPVLSMDTSTNKTKTNNNNKKKKNLQSHKTKKVPMLHLRYKIATSNDIQFIQQIQNSNHNTNKKNYKLLQHGIYANETFLSIRYIAPTLVNNMNLLHRQEKKNKEKEIMVCYN
jgi:hypothetical protein